MIVRSVVGHAPHGRVRRFLARDDGMVTAELAAAMPLLALLLAGALFAVNVATTQTRCLDAARDGALAESRGESGKAAAVDRAPPEATVHVDASLDEVTVRVETTVTPWGEWLPGWEVHGEATVDREPGFTW
ncbi:TadE family type IV pilus minor pilin [Stackebrandtia endophytica]|uniref:TadE family type IV pilus minor pilin n=1 Tax=Stackebrandtia endophytica TaxID=1496996 RepID=UPI001153BFFB|nr:TadE family type IV pilus minor pilin [Stackebrandtia endophytica]